MAFGALGFFARPAMEYDYQQDGQYNGGYNNNYSPVYEPVYNAPQPTYTPAPVTPVSTPVVTATPVTPATSTPVVSAAQVNAFIASNPLATAKEIEAFKAGTFEAGLFGLGGRTVTAANDKNSGVAIIDDLNRVYTEYKKPILIVGGLAIAYVVLK